jgi:hypothetical protein
MDKPALPGSPTPRDDLSDKLDQMLNEKAAYLHVYQDEQGGFNVIIDGNLSHAQLAIMVKFLDDAKKE